MFSAIIGAVAGGVASSIINHKQTSKLAEAYKESARQIRDAGQKYSGQNAYNAMQNRANEEANIMNQMALKAQASQGPQNTSNALANAANLSGNYNQGYNLGAQNEKSNLNAKYNAATAKAQQALNQAGIDYKAGTAATQAAFNTAGGLANLYKNMKPAQGQQTSDENQKEGINNESNLPKSDIEDSLRQLETVSYKYKDPSVEGCDDETHESGFTAQSLEKTPMGKDIVKEGSDGIKRVDQWKLREALTAGLAQMQREIDQLKLSKGD